MKNKKRRRLKKSVKIFFSVFIAVLIAVSGAIGYFVYDSYNDNENAVVGQDGFNAASISLGLGELLDNMNEGRRSAFGDLGEAGAESTYSDVGYEEIYKIELTDAYPADLRQLFEKNAEAREFVLSYFVVKDTPQVIDLSEYENTNTVPHFLQWDTRWGFLDYGGECVAVAGCGPVCLSMVGYYLTRDEETFAPDKVVEYALDYGYCIEDVGTAWALMEEGAEDLGLTSETLSLSERSIIESVQAGKPVILIMGPGVFTTVGHFIVIHGYEDGKFLVNDPNSIIRTEKKWSYDEFADQVLNLWSYSYDPFGSQW